MTRPSRHAGLVPVEETGDEIVGRMFQEGSRITYLFDGTRAHQCETAWRHADIRILRNACQTRTA